MKGKVLAAALVVVVSLMAFAYGYQAHARTIAPEPAVENLFAELNSGKLDAAVASFSEDAVARNLVQGKTYTGAGEIREMLAGMHREGRRLDVVEVQTDGERTILTAVVSDHGLAWGTERIEVGMKNGKIQSFDVTTLRLELWKIAR